MCLILNELTFPNSWEAACLIWIDFRNMILSQSWQMKMIYEPTLLLKVYCYACTVWQGYIAIEGPSVYCHCNVAPKRSHYLLKRAIIQFLILPIWGHNQRVVCEVSYRGQAIQCSKDSLLQRSH